MRRFDLSKMASNIIINYNLFYVILKPGPKASNTRGNPVHTSNLVSFRLNNLFITYIHETLGCYNRNFFSNPQANIKSCCYLWIFLWLLLFEEKLSIVFLVVNVMQAIVYINFLVVFTDYLVALFPHTGFSPWKKIYISQLSGNLS